MKTKLYIYLSLLFGMICVAIGNRVGYDNGYEDGSAASNLSWQSVLIEDSTYTHELLSAYSIYYHDTEELLDSLDELYDWSDTMDPIDYLSSKNDIIELQDEKALDVKMLPNNECKE